MKLNRLTLILAVFICTAMSAKAQMLWDFRIGLPNLNLDNFNIGLGVDIPWKTYDPNLSIQPALRFKYFEFENEDSDCDFEGGYKSMIEIPVKVGYKYPLWKNTNLRFSAGPYTTLNILTDVDMGVYQAGLATACTYEYKYVNFGLEYNLPFYQKFKNDLSNAVYFTLGVKFKSKAWKTIGTVAGAIAVVGASAAAAYSGNQSGGNVSSGDYTSDSSSGSSSKAKSKAKSSNSGGGDCKKCYGTGICQYCNGSGFNYVAGNPVKCTACNGLIGKCKWCKGSGKK